MNEWNRFDSRAILDQELARFAAQTLAEAIETRGHGYLVVSGGSTPMGFFQTLSQNQTLDWSKVTVTLADERWVAPDHADSNEALVYENLLQNAATSAQFASLYSGDDTPEIGAATLDAKFSALPTFDLVILGMGGDAHTASLFPNTPALTQGFDPQSPHALIAVHPTTAPHARISMTLARLLRTRNLLLHITGTNKAEVFEQAIAAESHASDMPIRAVALQQQTPLQVYYAD
ncbi:MAG: 6-phosphogluconolactonase [Aequoribacter sp.]|uniref:6-phosphogluconolactonase n=1 Tax=Aequoribacter sp. TaxID=2847771 RepID=UPI003C3F5669